MCAIRYNYRHTIGTHTHAMCAFTKVHSHAAMTKASTVYLQRRNRRLTEWIENSQEATTYNNCSANSLRVYSPRKKQKNRRKLEQSKSLNAISSIGALWIENSQIVTTCSNCSLISPKAYLTCK